MDSIHEHEFAQAAALEAEIYSEPADANCRQSRIARQPFRDRGREIDQGYAGGR
jgi:hypothetical protein